MAKHYYFPNTEHRFIFSNKQNVLLTLFLSTSRINIAKSFVNVDSDKYISTGTKACFRLIFINLHLNPNLLIHLQNSWFKEKKNAFMCPKWTSKERRYTIQCIRKTVFHWRIICNLITNDPFKITHILINSSITAFHNFLSLVTLLSLYHSSLSLFSHLFTWTR